MINLLKLNILIAAALVLGFSGLSAQSAAERTEAAVVIDRVNINGEDLKDFELNDIVIASRDSITFFFHCEVTKGEKIAFRFRITVSNETDSSSVPWNKTLAYYRNLPEGNYTFRIEAFDTRNRLNAEPERITFRVNDREAGLIKEIRKYKALAAQKDTITFKARKEEQNPGLIDWTSSLIGLVAGVASAGLFVVSTNKKKNVIKKFGKKKFKGGILGSNNGAVSKDEFDRIMVENSNLRAEIAALRGQIDALSLRTADLNKQNLELRESMEKLSNSKRELEELQKQKDDLFAVIIHDIKNPAALIKSLVDLLRSYDLTASEQQEVINDIFETTTKIVMLSQEVSKILTLEGNKVPLKMELAQIEFVLRDVHRRNTIAASNKSIEMLLDIQDNLPATLFDVQKIDEVVDNIISNAIKFSNIGGKVRISARRTDESIVVDISDNGLGLSEEDIKKAFQRGIKLSAQPTAGESSSGFGLWIVKKLVESHKGHVWVKSVLGKGSTFSFSIPVIQDEF